MGDCTELDKSNAQKLKKVEQRRVYMLARKKRQYRQKEKDDLLSSSASMRTERGIKEYLRRNFKTVFPHFELIGFEKAIYGAVAKRYLGLVDMIIKRGNRHLLVEIKNDYKTGISNVWSALKILGYAEAYRLERNVSVVPMIMVEKKFLCLDLLPILYNLKVGYITFECTDKLGYEFEYYIP